ncbi:MAG: DUF2784 family protein [Holophagaceae bacterium]
MKASGAALLAGLHLLAGAFALAGGCALGTDLRWAWLHAPVALWFILVNLLDWRCPLTVAERNLRPGEAGAGLEAGFLAHHALPRLGPRWTRRRLEVAVGLLLLAVNAAIYAWALAGR